MTQSTKILRAGALDELEHLLGDDITLPILAVIDTTAYVQSGACSRIERVLASRRTNLFTDFEPNPKIEDVLRGIVAYQACTPQVIVAIGGGTAIDIAKLISSLAHTDTPIDVVQGRDVTPPRQVKLIAVPTTAGTGSEATQFAVVYIDGEKYSLDHSTLLPDVAIIDPLLMHALPPAVTAATGLDALCQAIESMWAVNANEEAMEYAEQAISLACRALAEATHQPTPVARDAMCRASHLAGQAINITRTTACHALSYAITSIHGIPHGFAVAMTLIPMLQFNAGVCDEDCTDRRGAEAVRKRIARLLKAMGASNVDDATSQLLRLLQDIGCPVCLSHAGITSPAAVRQIAQSVNAQRMSNNPRLTTASILSQILTWNPTVSDSASDIVLHHHASSISHQASHL